MIFDTQINYFITSCYVTVVPLQLQPQHDMRLKTTNSLFATYDSQIRPTGEKHVQEKYHMKISI